MLTAVVVPFPITTTTKDVTCQYAAVDVATAKVITADVIVCYLGMLCKWKKAVLA